MEIHPQGGSGGLLHPPRDATEKWSPLGAEFCPPLQMHFRADAPYAIDLTRSLSTNRFVPGGKGTLPLLCFPIDWKITTDRIDHHARNYLQINQSDRAENDDECIRCDDVKAKRRRLGTIRRCRERRSVSPLLEYEEILLSH